MVRKNRTGLTTTQIIAFGFLAGILIGTFLLMLPVASADGSWTPMVDAGFTATTSICVTGLVTVNTMEHWSFFGQAVILLLIQFGGLGVVTFTTTVLLLLRKRITLKERLLIQDAYNLDTLRGLVKLTIQILKGTLFIEGIGACLYMFQFIPEFGVPYGIWASVFNAVSAMCNAGMDIVGEYSLMPYQTSVLINFTTMALIIMGGIGFPVWWDVLRVIKEKRKRRYTVRKMLSKLGLHSKIVISVTAILIFGGALVIFLLEYTNPNTIGSMNLWQKGMASLFQSVTTRTAGFLTVPQEALRDTTSFICILLMFVGGSPSGTAGGVKTTTVAMMVLAVISVIKGREDTEGFHRKISSNLVKKGMAVVLISLAVLVTSVICLSLAESGNFLEIFYECTSALATVGLSKGMTPNLSNAGKLILIVTMYIGRIGPITMALFFNRSRKKGQHRSLPEGSILVG